MPTLKIDDREFDTETLSQEALKNLQMLRVADAEIQQLQARLALMQTARNVYLQALKAALPTPLEQAQAQGETLKVS